MYNYLPHTDQIREEMLKEIGLESIEDLFSNINKNIRFDNANFNLPDGVSELEAKEKLTELANNNLSLSNCLSFLGGGTYYRYIPACIKTIVERSEFLTSYTPYQPEVSQGTLQVIYEYQSMICNLTGMDAANASVYDGAMACAEAVLMAARIIKKSKVLIASSVNPEYIEVIKTYCYGEGVDIDYISILNGKTDIDDIKTDDYACILIQNPNYLGSVEDIFKISEACKSSGAKFVVCSDLISLALIKSPASYGADIVVGDIQALGLPIAFGGPHGGFIACKTEYIRQMPGRIAGMTKDQDGKTAFTLTLQTREQHIRRAKATSNICSNQALMALAATVYISVMGPEGLKEAATISSARAHYLAEKINKIPGFKVLFNDFLYEFVVKVDDKFSSRNILNQLKEQNILAGIPLDDKFDEFKNCILVCVTEMNHVSGIERFTDALEEITSKCCLRS
ncbi:MAG: aminomethyl-transferring glycine dehydrogenase subunit GcvPA [Candidatus Gastranaerophilales bacterium]|nr:aminomethyl-transferring glycine dehydrogenase subunit GcvPA [Candidatus Gastranaerophilales bacterium]